MMTFLAIVGSISSLLVLAALAFGAYAAAMEVRERHAQRLRAHAQARAIREIGADIRMGAYWYSENPDAMRLVECIGDYLMEQGANTENHIRERWRALRGNEGGR